MRPTSVRRLEEALWGPRIGDPRLEVVGFGMLDALPRTERRADGALEERGMHVLAETGQAAGSDRRADGQGREITRGVAGPGNAREQRAIALGAHPAAIGRLEARHDALGTRYPGDGAADDAARFPHVPGTRRDQRVDGATVDMIALGAVARDRAVDQTGIAGVQCLVVDSQTLGRTWCIALDEDVGPI